MPLAILHSRALAGLDAPLVTVEVHLANGLPGFTLVGLPEAEVREARDRVRAAIQNARFDFPQRRITVNLAPADLPKEGGRFDLPIALGILAASGQIPAKPLAGYEFAGELSLGGELRPIRGALAMVLQAAGNGRAFVLPAANADEAALVNEATIHPAASLLQVCAHFKGGEPLPTHDVSASPPAAPKYPDLADIKGQPQARRALEVAAAGNHSLLLIGPPGTGKSMLASRLPGILPPMTRDEAMQSAAVRSLTESFAPDRFGQRPFAAPHHTASAVALVGGGSNPRPGEISRAHRGTLFLDELPEFDRKVLEVLREPLESGKIHISRAARHAEFPARFQLVAAMNPCPCGFLGTTGNRCRCTPDQVARYQGRISGPLLDRIDLRIEVPALSADELQTAPAGEPSAAVAARVLMARERQMARQGTPNAQLGTQEIDRHCQPDTAGSGLLRQAIDRLGLSARAYHRILRIARTIADMQGAPAVGVAHVAEAIHYRRGLREGAAG